MSLDTQLTEKSAALAAAKDHVASFDDKIKDAQAAHADPEKAPRAGTEAFNAVENLLKERASAVGEEEKLAKEERQILTLMGATGSAVSKVRAENTLNRGGARAAAQGWRMAHLLEQADVKAALEQTSRTRGEIGRQSLGEVLSQDDLLSHATGYAEEGAAVALGAPMAADVETTELMQRGEFRGVLPQPRRQLTLLSLIAQATSNEGNGLDWVEETGSYDTAREQVPGERKAEADVNYEDRFEEYATIAHFKKIKRQRLRDSAYLRSSLQNRLKYGLFRRVETQIVSGNGVGANLLGLRGREGVGATALAGGLPADRLLDGAVSIILTEGTPNGMVLHPRPWAEMLKKKADGGGDGQYFSGGPFGSNTLRVWGYPVVHNNGVLETEGLVGDWQGGAELVWRSGVQMLFSDSDGDDFVENRVTFLAEVDAGIAVFRPQWFNMVEVA